jgi:enterochelin esterase-like enzyme
VGALSVISVGFLALLFGLAGALWVGLLVLRRRGSRLLLVTLTASALLLSVASSADAVNAHYQYLPRLSDVLGQRDWPTVRNASLTLTPTPTQTQPPRTGPTPAASPASAPRSSGAGVTEPRGAVISIRVNEVGVGFPGRTALVYLPPQYFTDLTRRFPVVYLLHGSPGMPVDWLRGGDAAAAGFEVAARGNPQILVMPHLSRNWLDDSECVDGAHMRVETYVLDDLIPAVDRQLRTEADRAGRSVGGMSAGGYCALNLGLRNRGTFGAIIDMSGYTRPTHTGGMVALFGSRPDLAGVVAANTPETYGPDLAASPTTRLFFLCGRSDREPLNEMAQLRNVLEARGLPVTWVTTAGGHTYGVWRPGLVTALAWNRPAGIAAGA